MFWKIRVMGTLKEKDGLRLMHERRRTMIKRTLYVVIMAIVLTMALFTAHEIETGGTYGGELDTVRLLSSYSGRSLATEQMVAEPEDAYTLVRLTFGGNCTPGSMLGSSAYGTLNAAAEEEGMSYFLSDLSDVFLEDDYTLLGCAAVLGDGELTPKEKADGETLEWYLAPSDNAEIFASSGVEFLSMENDRVMDYGEEGLLSTEQAVQAHGLLFGSSSKAIYVDRAGIRIGILCCSMKTEADTVGALAWVTAARETCDYCVAYVDRPLDSGSGRREQAEREETDASAAMENDSTVFGRALIDAGYDLVCFTGGGDGCTAAAYGDGVVVDSLRYLFDGGQRFPETDSALYCVTLTVRGGAIEQAEGALLPVRITEEPWKPALVEREESTDPSDGDTPAEKEGGKGAK